MDEKSGMNFSEYVAILSGNTDLLEKAKLEKKIAGLDSERQAFIRSKSSSRSRLDEVMRTVDGNKELIARFQSDWDLYQSRVQKDKDGNILNPITLKGVGRTRPETHCRQARGNQRESLHTGRVFQYRNTLRI